MIDLTFITGKITYDELSSLQDTDLSCQTDLLKEDMLQVEYQDSLILDVGWYPSFNANGYFQIRVLKEYDWDAPLFYSRTTTISLLTKQIIIAQESIKKNQ